MDEEKAKIAKECLEDVISHYGDFKFALEGKRSWCKTEDDKSYWQHQLNVLDRMKSQAEQVTLG